MMGRSHLASGALVGAGAAWLFELQPAATVGFVAITTAATLLPDWDHPDATAPRYFGWPGRFVAWVIGSVFGHRGLTHSLVGVLALVVVLAFIPAVTALPLWVSAGVVLGCVTHIVGDMLTVSGVPLLWPADRRFRIGWMETGGFFETTILCPLFIAGATVLGAVAVL